MAINLTDSIRVGQQKPVEDKYFNGLVPYTSIDQVNDLLPKAIRHIGLTVNIKGEEYWYKDGIENANLVLKVPNLDAKLDANYVHDQAQPSSIWTINHPLNKKVSVTVTDTAGTVVEGQVIIKDNSQVIIMFNNPFSGIAVLN